MKKKLFLLFLGLFITQYNECMSEPYDTNAYNKAWHWNGEIDWNNGKILDLSEINLSQAPMSNFNLSYAKCYKTNLSSSDLSDAKLISTNLRKATLFKTNLSNTNLKYSILQNANAQKTNFTRCNLRWANFQGADLTKANFQGAIFRETNLENTIVKDADFNGARGLLNAQKAYLRSNGASHVPEDAYPEELVKEDSEILAENIAKLIHNGCKLTKKLLKAILWDLPRKAVSSCKMPDCG